MNNKIVAALFLLVGAFSVCATDSAATDDSKRTNDRVFHLIITNETDAKIKIMPISDAEEFKTDAFKLNGEVIIAPTGERTFPPLKIKGKASVPAKSRRNITVTLGDIDFSATGLAEGASIVQRMAVNTAVNSDDDDEPRNATIGYMSFRCSISNMQPIITFESVNSDYQIIEDQSPVMGNCGIRVIVKKK